MDKPCLSMLFLQHKGMETIGDAADNSPPPVGGRGGVNPNKGFMLTMDPQLSTCRGERGVSVCRNIPPTTLFRNVRGVLYGICITNISKGDLSNSVVVSR